MAAIDGPEPTENSDEPPDWGIELTEISPKIGAFIEVAQVWADKLKDLPQEERTIRFDQLPGDRRIAIESIIPSEASEQVSAAAAERKFTEVMDSMGPTFVEALASAQHSLGEIFVIGRRLKDVLARLGYNRGDNTVGNMVAAMKKAGYTIDEFASLRMPHDIITVLENRASTLDKIQARGTKKASAQLRKKAGALGGPRRLPVLDVDEVIEARGDMTQAKFARKLHMSIDAVQKAERGKTLGKKNYNKLLKAINPKHK